MSSSSSVPPGSSPLARGLPALGPLQRRFGRIIPARAGFTWREHPISPSPADHPRSRGVYHLVSERKNAVAGSSPLARGLHVECFVSWLGLGIIPARAGFTSPRGRRCRAGSDHPRSRGVYERYGSASVGDLGSSPLARGLHDARAVAADDRRIIPARAGFTWRSCRRCTGRRDHPRSRGVYASTVRTSSAALGSSPLARGLRPRSPDRDGADRIIPARAGFTRRRRGAALSAEDHPRSRGVYYSPCDRSSMSLGSSPLARGLRGGQGPAAVEAGIIPARAGFTRSRPPLTRPRPDHPRSRGVYP